MKEVSKMTKKQKKEFNKLNRVLEPMNLGIIEFKSAKWPSRNELKNELRKRDW